MVFSSVLFLFYFLPAVIFFYYISGRARNYVLLVFSLVFYLFGGTESFPLIIISIILNYTSGLVIGTCEEKRSLRKAVLAVTVVADVSLLFYFKYFNFAGDVYRSLCSHFSFLPLLSFPQVTLPIGISFYTFQGMAYVIDVYRRQTEPQKDLTKVALYISMFPQLIAGPIVRYGDVRNDMTLLSVKKGLPVSSDRMCEGVIRFIKGLGKKVIFADVLGESVGMIFDMDITSVSTGIAWFGILAYTLEIYFDFSGYSDMAIGLGKILGYDFPENFNLPYRSASIREFWRRWHITLSSWFRDYLYIPLGGSRRGNVYLNIFIVFLCTGLWHGADWTFILWGIWHGLLLILERLTEKGRARMKPVRLFGWLYCMLAVCIGWVIFRSDSISYAWMYVKCMFGFTGGTFNYINVLHFLNRRNIVIFTAAACCSLGVPGMIYSRLGESAKRACGILTYPAALIVLAVSLFVVINGNYSPFIYFRF